MQVSLIPTREKSDVPAFSPSCQGLRLHMHQVKVAEEHVCPLIVILWLDQRIVAHKHSAQFEPITARQLMLGSSPSKTAGEISTTAKRYLDAHGA